MRGSRADVDGARQIRVAVIGDAGVGKSTLINALISERLPLLPQGGIGPLTATPIEVRHAKDPYLRVDCLGSTRVREMLDSCNPAVSREAAFGGAGRALRQMAALVASDSQFGQVPDAELFAFLRGCLNDELSVHIPMGLRHRADRVRAVVTAADFGKPLQIEAGMNLPGLLVALADHGAGFLAPLTSRIQLGWDAPVLANDLTLIDLPGLGVANDIHRRQTQVETTPFHAILLVVERSGLTDASAVVLRRAMCATQRPDDQGEPGAVSPTLLVAATKLDQPAGEAVARASGSRNWNDICYALGAGAKVVIRAQLDSALSRAPTGNSRPSQPPFAGTHVIPVFPQEYQRLHRGDSEYPARLENAAATGIPCLVERLQEIARQSAASAMT